MKKITAFLKAISDENRLLILLILSNKELCVCDLQTLVPLSQGALSIQLKNLSTIGLVQHTKQGKWVFYRLAQELPSFQASILQILFQQLEKEKSAKGALTKLKKIKRTTENCN